MPKILMRNDMHIAYDHLFLFLSWLGKKYFFLLQAALQTFFMPS